MADECCDRVDTALHEKGIQLHSKVGLMGNLDLRVSNVQDGVRISRRINVENFSKWTPEKFKEFEELAIKELTK